MNTTSNDNFLHPKKPSAESTSKTISETQKALEKLTNKRIKTYQSFKTNNLIGEQNKTNQLSYKYINYKSNSNNSNSHLIKLVSLPVDPLSSVKFRHHKIAQSNTNENNFVPVLQEPSKKISYEEQKKWKIPPCVSIAKNPKGLVIPLDIRLANDGRNLREFQTNKNFAKFADVLNMAEKKVKSEIQEHNKIAKSIQIAAAMKKEQELKEAAKIARQERNSFFSNVTFDEISEKNSILNNKRKRDDDAKKERDELRLLRKKEIEYDIKIEKQKKYEGERDTDIYFGGVKNIGGVDTRLYEKEGGIENKLDYNEDCEVYDKPLFDEKNKISNIYKTYNNSGAGNSRKLISKMITQGGKMFNSDLEVLNSRKEGPIQFEKSVENN